MGEDLRTEFSDLLISVPTDTIHNTPHNTHPLSPRNFADALAGFVSLVHVTPTAILRNTLTENFPTVGEARVLAANTWVRERLEADAPSLDGYDLASRITLAYTMSTVGHISLESEKILVVEVNDECVTTATVRHELRQRYPDAKVGLSSEFFRRSFYLLISLSSTGRGF